VITWGKDKIKGFIFNIDTELLRLPLFSGFFVITIEPTIANNNIIPVIIIHIGTWVYIVLPILVMWLLSHKVPSHTRPAASGTSIPILGIELPTMVINKTPIIIANDQLLLVLDNSSLILTFISIKIKRNKIDTAPT